MPTYQYTCTDCGEPLEAVQAFTDDPLTRCPACGGRLRKVFSAVGVVFKGSGFYRTDSRSAAAAKDGGAKERSGEGAASDGAAGGKDSGAGTSKETGKETGKDTAARPDSGKDTPSGDRKDSTRGKVPAPSVSGRGSPASGAAASS